MTIVYTMVYTNYAWSLFLIVIINPNLLSPLGCRVLLNMQKASDHSMNAGMTFGLTSDITIGTMDQDDEPRSTDTNDSNTIC